MPAFGAQGDKRLPRVSAHVIGRPRVNAALDDGAPLTLLRGAAGSGKTTALVGWAFTSPDRVVWLTATPALATSAALAAARPDARLTVWEGVNHLLKLAPADRAANIATYSDPTLPLAPGVVGDVAGFILQPRSPGTD